MRVRFRQLDLPIRSWGGRRQGSGRKPSKGRRNVPHRQRVAHESRCPVHVTLRARKGLPSFRDDRVFGAVRRALAQATGAAFRVIHFSVQRDHVHLVIEADSHRAMIRGMQGLAIRVARAVNRAIGRYGRVWGDRYHARLLRTPREVRNALVYVLQNFRKHLRNARGLDPRSSAAWFTGWRTALRDGPSTSPPIAKARTWLAAFGWRRHGLIGVNEAPVLR